MCVSMQSVELSDCEQTQALALQVLLSLAKYNQHRIHEMDCCHGYSMIHQVLIKAKCIVGYHMLKVRLIACALCALCGLERATNARFPARLEKSLLVTQKRTSTAVIFCCIYINFL